MAPAPTRVAYRAGRCALCDGRIEASCTVQEVGLHVFGLTGTVTLQCWLCSACQPTPATLLATTGTLLQRVLGWYGSTPLVWPTLRLARRD